MIIISERAYSSLHKVRFIDCDGICRMIIVIVMVIMKIRMNDGYIKVLFGLKVGL